jgi:hypothetical protein
MLREAVSECVGGRFCPASDVYLGVDAGGVILDRAGDPVLRYSALCGTWSRWEAMPVRNDPRYHWGTG